MVHFTGNDKRDVPPFEGGKRLEKAFSGSWSHQTEARSLLMGCADHGKYFPCRSCRGFLSRSRKGQTSVFLSVRTRGFPEITTCTRNLSGCWRAFANVSTTCLTGLKHFRATIKKSSAYRWSSDIGLAALPEAKKSKIEVKKKMRHL